MANTNFGKVVVFSVEQYQRKDNTVGFKVTALTEEAEPRLCVFYKDGSEGVPEKGMKYVMTLGIDSKFKAIVRFVRE